MRKIIFLLCTIAAVQAAALADEVTTYGPSYHTRSTDTDPNCEECNMSLLTSNTRVLEVKDNWYFNEEPDTKFYSEKSVIEFGIDWTADYFDATPFGARLIADVTYWDENDDVSLYPAGASTFTCTLEVVYDATAQMHVKSVDNYVFSKGLRFEVSVASLKYYDPDFITERTSYDPKNVYLTGYVVAERYHELDVDAVFSFTTDAYDCGDDKINVSWAPIEGAEEYELMWTFVDAGAVPQAYSFINNHTKIITRATSYDIPVIYEEGTIVFTARAVGRNIDLPSELVYSTDWSIGDLAGSLSPPPSGHIIEMIQLSPSQDCMGFERDKNWQYSISFAEEGKTKEVISYFDGTLRKRQTVARNNTDEKAIVANTIYDTQGRPAIETLPVPDMDDTNPLSTKLGYHNLISLSDDSPDPVPYTSLNFDYDVAACQTAAVPMMNSAGPGLYYSDQNPIQTAENAYIPDAQQYPFVQTEYMPDNTGRIRAQGGAGIDHQLGSGHETKYWYGMPLQVQLDRLFANDVGYADHYTRDMVMDPNGTISITYKNASGKVIATALGGDPTLTTALKALESSQEEDQEIIANLMDFSNRPSEEVLNVNYTKLVSEAGEHLFHYDVTRESFNPECLPEGVCFDCVYELELSIKDECSVELVPETLQVVTLGEANITCDELEALEFTIDPDPLVLNLAVGAYTINKTLRLSSDARQYYLEQYLLQVDCITPFQTFLDEAEADIDFSVCGMDCEECLTRLGDYENYSDSENEDPEYLFLTVPKYLQEVAECNKLCLDGISPCDSYKQLMLADMSPGGQYAPFTFEFDTEYPTEGQLTGIVQDDPFSIFYTYYNPSGTPSLDIDYAAFLALLQTYLGVGVTVRVEDQDVVVADLTPQQLTEVWKREWAEVFLPHHPEYCYYEFCLDHEDSYRYDRDFAGTSSFAEANAAGYMNPLKQSAHNPPFTYTSGTETGDPLFISGTTETPDYYDLMEAVMNDYPYNSFVTEHKNIWEVTALAEMNDIDPAVCENNDYWTIFKGLYQAIKQAKLGEIMQTECPGIELGDKDPRFFTSQEQMNEEAGITEHYNTINDMMDNPTPNQSGAIEYIDGLMDNQFSLQCTGYAVEWLESFAPCRPVGMSDPTWEAEKADIKNHLIEICVLGSDVNNTLGASSSQNACPHGFNNFEQVIQDFITRYHIEPGADCNPYIIGFPKPQGHSYFNGSGGTAVLDTCACDRLEETHGEFVALGGDLPPGICTEQQYFESIYGKPFPDIEELFKSCNINRINICFFPRVPVLTCEYMQGVYQNYLIENSLPSNTDYTTIDSDVLTAYINNILVTEEEYEEEWLLSRLECFTILGKCITTPPDPPVSIDCRSFMAFAGAYEDGIIITDPRGHMGAFTTAANTEFGVSYSVGDYLHKLSECRGNYVDTTYIIDFTNLHGTLTAINSFPVISSLPSHGGVEVTSVTGMDFYTDHFNVDPGCDIWIKGTDFYLDGNHGNDTAYAAYTVQPDASDSITPSWSYPLYYYGGEKLTLYTSAWSDQNKSGVKFAFNSVDGGSFSGSNSFTENLTANVKSTHAVTINTDDGGDSLVFYLFSTFDIGGVPDTLNVRVAIPNLNYSPDTKHYSEELFVTFIDSCSPTVTVRKNGIQLVKPDSIAWEDVTEFRNIRFVGGYSSLPAGKAEIAKLRSDMAPYFRVDAVITGGDTVTFYGGEKVMPAGTVVIQDPGLPPTPVPAALACSRCIDCDIFTRTWMQFLNKTQNNDVFADETQSIFDPTYVVAFTNYINNLTNNNFTAPQILRMAENCFTTADDNIVEGSDDYIDLLNQLLAETYPEEYSNEVVPLDVAPYASEVVLLDGFGDPVACEATSRVTAFSNGIFTDVPLALNAVQLKMADECGMEDNYTLLFSTAIDPTDIVSILDITGGYHTGEHSPGDGRYYLSRISVILSSGDTVGALLQTPVELATLVEIEDFEGLCPGNLIPVVEANPEDDCIDYLMDVAKRNATMEYNRYLDGISNQFISDYTTACIGVTEHFTMQFDDNEHHYTMYYYDQAGNLVKTVPPQGVRFVDLDAIVTGSTTAQQMINAHRTNAANPRLETEHIFNSNHIYNTLNQATQELTPDGGTKQVWYDRLGRPVLSQSAQQAADQAFTHTVYDEQGRPARVERVHFTGTIPLDLPSPWPPTNAETWEEAALQDWAAGFDVEFTEMVATIYDEPLFSVPGFVQENLRGRVVAVVRSETDFNPPDVRYDFATHYSYDIHGNVKTLVHEVPNADPFGMRYVRIDYEYDLVSGNVKQVWYQQGKPDQFTHKYTYDADNRIAQVFTSTDGIIWHNDAEYDYYMHGPLARTALGDIKVQGSDYAYTIQGWMKTVNAASLNSTRDIGQDGEEPLQSAKDAMGFTLGYYNGDYTGIGGSSFEPALTSSDPFYNAVLTNPGSDPGLFNGNITQMVTSLMATDRSIMPAAGNAYQYDQLNRITEKNVFLNPAMHLDAGTGANTWDGVTASSATEYYEDFSYDANGNIYTLNRNGANGNESMDALEYYYWGYDSYGAPIPYKFDADGIAVDASGPIADIVEFTNKLAYVDDDAGFSSNYPDDIDQQNPANYTYDLDGNLKTDAAGGIDNINWNTSGKISNIDFTNGDKLIFYYDVMGNRIAKYKIPFSGDPSIYAYYRDAQGNTMATYQYELGDGIDMHLKELMLYGSSRIGILNHDVIVGNNATIPDVLASDEAESEIDFEHIWFDTENEETPIIDPFANTGYNEYIPKTYGHKMYELSNHLGNILSVITDRKVPVEDSPDQIEYYNPWVLSVSDYYAFGSLMPERNEDTPEYRYGFNGKEKDDEVAGNGNQYDYGFRIYNPGLGRFLSVDPLTKGYPWYTPYQFAGNNPIAFIDLDGLEEKKPEIKTNVLIVIVSEEEIKEIVNSGSMGTFQVILAINVVDANKQFQKYRGNEKIDNLVVRTHGTDKGGEMDLDNKSKLFINSKYISIYNSNPSNKAPGLYGLVKEYYEQVKALDEIMGGVEEDGNCVITTCNGGKGVDGVTLGQELNRMTEGKINIFLNQDYSTRKSVGGALQIYIGENNGLTNKEYLKDGWTKIARDGEQTNLKDTKNGVQGNIILDSRSGKEPIQIK